MTAMVAFIRFTGSVAIPTGLQFVATGLQGIPQNVQWSFLDGSDHFLIKEAKALADKRESPFLGLP
jgi:hypothetical protein